MINDATGTATPIAGFLVMFGFNNPMTVVIYGVVMAIVGGLAGWIGSLVFKKYPIVTKQDMIDRALKTHSTKINLLCIVVTKKVFI